MKDEKPLPRVSKILGTGGRDWPDDRGGCYVIRKALIDLRRAAGEGARMVLVHGACKTGADAIMDRIGRELGFDVRPCPVDHSIDGPWPAAGPRRNQRMLDTHNTPEEPINASIAFPTPGSKGTWDMVRRAEAAGLFAHTHYLPEETR